MTGAFLKITDITVSVMGPDMVRVYFHTNLPLPEPYEGKLTIMGLLPRDVQEEWLDKHFPDVPVEQIIEG